jgi:hypothetical protein
VWVPHVFGQKILYLRHKEKGEAKRQNAGLRKTRPARTMASPKAMVVTAWHTAKLRQVATQHVRMSSKPSMRRYSGAGPRAAYWGRCGDGGPRIAAAAAAARPTTPSAAPHPTITSPSGSDAVDSAAVVEMNDAIHAPAPPPPPPKKATNCSTVVDETPPSPPRLTLMGVRHSRKPYLAFHSSTPRCSGGTS